MSGSGQVIDLGGAGDVGWSDVMLPTGALKSGKLHGLIGFQEYVPPNPIKKKEKKGRKRARKAAVLFGESEPKKLAVENENVMETDQSAPVQKRQKKVKKPKQPLKKAGVENANQQLKRSKKKKQKKRRNEQFEQTEEEQAISNEQYKFENDLTEWRRFNIDIGVLRAIDQMGLKKPSEIQLKTIPPGLNTKKTILGSDSN